jgi:hypothetical protein
MADETISVAINLKDGVSAPAQSAASRLSDLKSKLQQDTAALSEMQRVMRTLKGATNPNTQAIGEMSKRMAALKASSASVAEEIVSLGGDFGKGAKSAAVSAVKIEGLHDILGALGGRAGQAGGMLKNLSGAAGIAGVASAAVAAVAALLAMAAAIGVAVGAMASFALASAGARRAEALRLEGLTKTINYWGIAAGKASDLQSAIDRVSGESALGRGQIEGYATSLYKMGLRGGNLSKALEATATVASAQGEEMASAFMGMAAGAAAVGSSVDKMADRVKSRLGGIAKAQALDFGVQMSKLRENVARIFSGVKIEGFLSALSTVTRMFSQNEATGRALKTIVESLFNPLFGGASGAEVAVKRFVQGFTIGLLLIAIKIFQVRNYLRDMFAKIDTSKLDAALLFLAVGAATAFTMALAVFGIVAAVAALAFAFTLPLVGLAALVAGVMYLSTLEWGSIATNLINGLVNGITSGASAVLEAVKALATKMKSGFTSALGIASPSKVFRAYGEFTAEGAAQGIEAGTADVQGAAERMVSVPAAAPRGTAAARGPSIVIQNLNVTGGSDARGLAMSVKLELERILEGVAIEMGAPAV